MKKNTKQIELILGIATGVSALALGFVAFVYSEIPSASYVFAALTAVFGGALVFLKQKALKQAMGTRSVRYGANALLTVGLVFGILGVINFLNFNHYWKKDITKDRVHSLSDQTIKLLKDAKQEVKITAFVKPQMKDKTKSLLDNYTYFSKKITVEYVDPDRNPERTKAANIKEYGTLVIAAGEKKTNIQDANEEKLTNALIKVMKEKTTTVCFLTGHGEKNAEGAEAEGYSQVKKDLAGQSYESKSINLLEEGKVPADCDILLVLGPTKAFFEKEVQVLSPWLNDGGRAVFAFDPNLRGGPDNLREIKGLLSKWGVEFQSNLVLDPTSRLLGVNASVPIVGNYSKDHPATKDFTIAALFPMSSTVGTAANMPPTLKSWWLAKSTPKAFAKTDFKEIATGQVRLDEKKDKVGDHTLMVAVEGTLSAEKKSAKPARIVAMGTSNLATNGYARHGANLDLFLNVVSWLGDDENLISIRAKEEEAQPPKLSETEGRFIQLLTMVMMPGMVLSMGGVTWFRRRKL